MSIEQGYQPATSYIRVATACPEVAVGNVDENIHRVSELYAQAVKQDASVVVFPEMSLTGYTIGDVVQDQLLQKRAKEGLLHLAAQTANTQTALVVGLPLSHGNDVYNCTAVLASGQIQGIVAKADLPNNSEFYEGRWFRPWRGDNQETVIGDQTVPIGTDLVFQVGQTRMGVEPCHALWVPQQPSVKLAAAGATIVVNPSASPEQVTKDDYRRQLVAVQSGRLVMAYVYASCDASESTTDIVMGGHQLIAENGHVLAEREPLSLGQELTFADIDIDHLLTDRRKETGFPNEQTMPVIDCGIIPEQTDSIRKFNPAPFIPKGPEAEKQLQRIFDIQAQGLATRLKNAGVEKVVLGLSGGLDSTLALFVAIRAAERLGRLPADVIQTITMPGEASSERTQDNAQRLAAALGIPNKVIPIGELAQAKLKALGHTGEQDVTYENVQARERTSLLFDEANQINGLVLGTGDLSEIALGWCTFNGDHMSHYNVNASVPKTLVKHLVAFAVQRCAASEAGEIVQGILDTPISPELTKAADGEISQQTEDLLGPFELHDFFLYYFVRWHDTPVKIQWMAEQAFNGQYERAEISRWLQVFLKRFMQSQFKRSVFADGPKVGSVSLSPRGDWRAPSDMSGTLWTNAVQ